MTLLIDVCTPNGMALYCWLCLTLTWELSRRLEHVRDWEPMFYKKVIEVQVSSEINSSDTPPMDAHYCEEGTGCTAPSYEPASLKRWMAGRTQRHHSVHKEQEDGRRSFSSSFLVPNHCKMLTLCWQMNRLCIRKELFFLKTDGRFIWTLRSITGNLKDWFILLRQGVTGADPSS